MMSRLVRAAFGLIVTAMSTTALRAADVSPGACVVDLVVPSGTETSLDGGPFQSRAVVEWTGLEPQRIVTGRLTFRFADGSTAERTVWVESGRRYPLVVQGPRSNRPELVVRVGHADGIFGKAYDSTGARLVTGDLDGVVILWNAETGEEQARWQLPHRILVTEFVENDARVAVVSERDVSIWDPATSQQVRAFRPLDAPIMTATFSADRQLVLTIHEGGHVRLTRLDDENAQRKFELPSDSKHARPYYWLVELTADAQGMFVFGMEDGGRRLCSTTDGRVLQRFEEFEASSLPNPRPSPAGAVLARPTFDQVTKRTGIAVWERATGRPWQRIELPEGAGLMNAWGDDGLLVGQPEGDGLRYEIWDAKTLRPRHRVPGLVLPKDHYPILTRPALGRLLFSHRNGLLDVETATGRIRWKSFGGEAVMLAFSPQAEAPYLQRTAAGVGLVDAASQQVIAELFRKGDHHSIYDAAFSRDGKFVVVNTAALSAIDRKASHEIYVYDVATKTQVAQFRTSDRDDYFPHVQLSSDGRTAVGDSEAQAVAWDVRTGRRLGTLAPKSPKEPNALTATFAADGRTVLVGAMGVNDGSLPKSLPPLVAWNVHDGTTTDLEPLPEHYRFSPYGLAPTADGKFLIACGYGGDASRDDVRGHVGIFTAAGALRRLVRARSEFARVVAHPTDGLGAILHRVDDKNVTDFLGVESVDYLRTLDGKLNSFTAHDRLVSMSDDEFHFNSTRLVDLKSGDEVLRIVRFDNGTDWIAVTPEGLFDGSEIGRKQVAFRVGGSPKLVAVDRFFQDFYRPGLVPEALRGERPLPQTDFAAQAPPHVVIEGPAIDGDAGAAEATIVVVVRNQGGGVKGPWLMHNGVRLADAGERVADGKLIRQAFHITLVPGENRIEARAASGDGSWESEPARRTLRLDRAAAGPAVHLLAVGIDKYATETMNLRFAAADARAVAGLFSRRGPALYADRVSVRTLHDDDATAAGIRAAVDALARQCNPQDTVVVFLAGHGVTVGQRYYFIPHELRHQAERFEDDVRRDGLPVDVLNDWLGKAQALKRVLILDTCQSGGALSLLGGGARDPFAFRGALERLSFATGTFTIAAAPAGADAQELDALGHGILTYALLAAVGAVDDGPLKNQGLRAAGDAPVAEVRDWFAYAQDKVPLLSKLYLGKEQFVGYCGQGSSFPLLPLADPQK